MLSSERSKRYASRVLLLDTSRSPEVFVPRLLALYFDGLEDSRRVDERAALAELAGPERSPEELLIGLLEVAPDESIAWLHRQIDSCPLQGRVALARRLAVLAELVQLAEERYLEPELLVEVRARHGESLGDALVAVLSRSLSVL